MGLEQELEIELIKMGLKEKCKIKTSYSNGDMPEEFSVNQEEYFKQVNSNRGLLNHVKKL